MPIVHLPQGLIGFESHQRFFWSDVTDARFSRFRVLRCMDDPSLVFLVLPLHDAAGLPKPCETAMATLGPDSDDRSVYFIVTPKREGNAIRPTANLRAPLIVDRCSDTARQVVIEDENLSFAHPL